MLFDNAGHRFYPLRRFIEAADVMKFAATCGQEIGLGFHRNFFQGLETVAGKAGAQNIDPLDTFVRQFFQGRRGIRLQPFGFAETGLESDQCLVFRQSPLRRSQQLMEQSKESL